jgi:hypothetical protein
VDEDERRRTPGVAECRNHRQWRTSVDGGELEWLNFYFNGGGWGRISYRYAHVGSGVQFIY